MRGIRRLSLGSWLLPLLKAGVIIRPPRRNGKAMSSEATSSPEIQTALRGRRLESWKEIAVHLGRDVTTVRRWEKREGLPVYRLQHSKLGSVYAYTSELDAWRDRRALAGETDAPNKITTDRLRVPGARSWLAFGGLAVLA